MGTIHGEAGQPTRMPRRAVTEFEVIGPVDAAVTLVARGSLDADAVVRWTAAARTAERRVSEASVGRMVVDLIAVTYLPLEALAPLIRLARHCQDTATTLQVIASAPARARIQMTGLAGALPVQE